MVISLLMSQMQQIGSKACTISMYYQQLHLLNYLQCEIQRKHFLLMEAGVCYQVLLRTLLHIGKKKPNQNPAELFIFPNFV